jgi:hypothetical protein
MLNINVPIPQVVTLHTYEMALEKGQSFRTHGWV